jgi:hypothetical protein
VQHGQLCSEEKIAEYPTLRLFSGTVPFEAWQGERSHGALVQAATDFHRRTAKTVSNRAKKTRPSVDDVLFQDDNE